MQDMGGTRMEVVACLAATYAVGNAGRLSMFGPEGEDESVGKAIAEIVEMPEQERVEHIVGRLRSLVACEEFTALADVHPAWLVEVLSKESPRIIGIILRYLPSKQVRFIIEHLPKRIKNRLPQLIDSFAVPSPILKIIKERFERQFTVSRSAGDLDEFTFENISSLKSVDLETLLKDLGIHELAMALKGVDRNSMNILYNRLSIDEARSLQQRIRSLVDVSPQLLKDAKYTVLEMSLAETEPDVLLMDVGLNAFARALTREDVNIYPLIKQKLEPRLGYSLKRYMDQHIDSNITGVSGKRRELIVSRIESLSKAGSIDQNIARYFLETGVTDGFHVPPSSDGPPAPVEGKEKSDSWQSGKDVL